MVVFLYCVVLVSLSHLLVINFLFEDKNKTRNCIVYEKLCNAPNKQGQNESERVTNNVEGDGGQKYRFLL